MTTGIDSVGFPGFALVRGTVFSTWRLHIDHVVSVGMAAASGYFPRCEKFRFSTNPGLLYQNGQRCRLSGMPLAHLGDI